MKRYSSFTQKECFRSRKEDTIACFHFWCFCDLLTFVWSLERRLDVPTFRRIRYSVAICWLESESAWPCISPQKKGWLLEDDCLSYWVSVTFQGANCQTSGGVTLACLDCPIQQRVFLGCAASNIFFNSTDVLHVIICWYRFCVQYLNEEISCLVEKPGIPVVPGQAGGGSFQSIKKNINL